MWYKKKFFEYIVAIILILLTAWLLIQVRPLIYPVFEFITTLLFPVLIAGLLYYVFRPLRDFLEEKKVPRLLAIALIYMCIIICIAVTIVFIWPFLSKEINAFIEAPNQKIAEIKSVTVEFFNLFNVFSLSEVELQAKLTEWYQAIVAYLTQNILSAVETVTRIASFVLVTPFILFYLLKDEEKLADKILRFVPVHYHDAGRKLLTDMDQVVSGYITGQLQVSVIDASLIFIGYTLIGLHYAPLLAVFALIFNMIPFVGTFIATIPAFFIGFAQSPITGLEVVAVVCTVHLLDMNIISPRIVGNRLNIHPITILLLLITSGALYGILGLFLATPLYALAKVIVTDLYGLDIFKKQTIT